MIEVAFAKIDPVALGVAIGVVSGLGIFMATAILLLRSGSVVGSSLSLLGNYLFGFKVTWAGAVIGLFEAGMFGFAVGAFVARLGNSVLKVYAKIALWRGERDERCHLLDKL